MKPTSFTRTLARMVRRPFRRRARIVMTLLCRDEEDIIGYNIAFHLDQGVDFIIATDNGSQDRTPLLLERFARQGKLHLIREPSLTHDQGVWVTRMARMAAKRFDADWVINSDADEFWLSRSGSLRDALQAAPREARSLAVPGFDMLPPARSGEKFFEAMVIRGAGGRTLHGAPSVPKICHRGYSDVRVAEGNHHIKRRGALVPAYRDHPLEILHFPLRSAAQFERKVRQGAKALLANPTLDDGIGAHWRWLHHNYPPAELAAYYDERVPDPDRISAGLADGRFAEDTRVRDALRHVDPALADPEGR